MTVLRGNRFTKRFWWLLSPPVVEFDFCNRSLQARRTGRAADEPSATLPGVSRPQPLRHEGPSVLPGRDRGLQSVRAMKTSNGVGRAPAGGRVPGPQALVVEVGVTPSTATW